MGLITKLPLVLLLTAAAVGCDAPVDRLLTEADRAKEADAIHRAARLYQEVTILAPADPRTVRAHFELAQIYYLRRRNIIAAKAELSTIVQEFPGSEVETEAKRLLARLYDEDLHDDETAIELYRQVLADETLAVDARRETLLELAHCHYRRGDTQRAAATYRELLRLPYHPDTAMAYLRLANLARLDGTPEEALRLARELASMASDAYARREAVAMEVDVLLSAGRLDAARARLDEAGRELPESAELFELDRRLREARSALAHDAREQRSLAAGNNSMRWGSGREPRPAGL